MFKWTLLKIDRALKQKEDFPHTGNNVCCFCGRQSQQLMTANILSIYDSWNSLISLVSSIFSNLINLLQQIEEMFFMNIQHLGSH